jgi:hypothetical protein
MSALLSRNIQTSTYRYQNTRPVSTEGLGYLGRVAMAPRGLTAYYVQTVNPDYQSGIGAWMRMHTATACVLLHAGPSRGLQLA